MPPDDATLAATAFDPQPTAASAVDRWLEIWVADDTIADTLLVLRSEEAGGCGLFDPQNGWRRVRRFASWEAAHSWLTQEAYEPAGGRCASR